MFRALLFSLYITSAWCSISNDEILAVTAEMYEQAGHAGDAFTINLQGKTTSSETTDKAPEPLITSVDQSVLDHPTIALLSDMFDNYIADENVPEDVTDTEMQEVDDFLNAVMETEVMKTAHSFLAGKGEVSSDIKEFQALIKQIWFDLYERNKELSSSGFEHVFIGEKDGSTVGGLHNWVHYYDLESSGAVDYQGYIEENTVDGLHIISYRMNWDSAKKPITTVLLGLYPEYELATLTLCWIARPNQVCTVNLGDYTTWQIQTWEQSYNGGTYVGTAYFI